MRTGMGAFAALALLTGGSSGAWAKCTVGRIAELKVTMDGHQPMVDVGIEGHKVRLLADSGAFFSTIAQGSAQELGLRLGDAPPGFRLMGLGGSVSASVARVRDFELAGVTLHRIDFVVGGGEVSGGVGLLGQNVLGLADVEYDLGHGAIRLMQVKDCGKANLAYWAGDRPVSMLSIDAHSIGRPHTIGTITINGKKVRAMFDTGADTSILSLSAAARAGVKPDSPGVEFDGMSHGIGRGVVKTWTAPFDSIDIGGERITHTKLRIGDIGLDDADMLVGADFFLSHRVFVGNSQQTMYFTYEGGAVFDVKPARATTADGKALVLPAAEPDPSDAAGFARRGAAFAARRDWTPAIADLTRATQMAPNDSGYQYALAGALFGADKPQRAREALDRSIAADPANADARIWRAGLSLERDERETARADLDAADRVLDAKSDRRLELAGLYSDAGEYDHAIADYGRWIDVHRDDSRLPLARNGRCWARALGGRELDRALDDCNAAIRARPGDASMLDSRGLVRLRMGDTQKAIADYDAALRAEPGMAWSLYGRGVAERRLGQAAKAEADIAAAKKAAPHIAERAARAGITD